ncbi:hypothetical protein H0H93_004542 [Arthromyces matolae]|nr:hypothetical protein H0H93_004542 [Arthromyces matolae]
MLHSDHQFQPEAYSDLQDVADRLHVYREAEISGNYPGFLEKYQQSFKSHPSLKNFIEDISEMKPFVNGGRSMLIGKKAIKMYKVTTIKLTRRLELILNTKTNRNPKLNPSKKKANAAGYAKRHSKKAQTLNGVSDIYEYAPASVRRSKVALDLDREETSGLGIGLDGDEETTDQLRARLIGEDGDDEGIASEDDEEIDSDAAFEESDEERFAEFFPNKKKSRKKQSVRFADVDLNEDEDSHEGKRTARDNDDDDEEEEEEGDSDEFIDVLDVLDGRGEVYYGSDDEASAQPKRIGAHDGSHEADDEEAMEEDESDEEMDAEDAVSEDEENSAFLPSDAEEGEPSALDDLQDFISTLDTTSKKRKVTDDSATGSERTKKQRKLALKERTEAGVENEFRAHTSGTKLNLDDLLAPLASQSSTLQSLKQSTKALASASSKVKTLSAPLPQRAQEKLDREAAYEQTKEELDTWSATMKRVRDAEHLSFPLQAPTAGRVSNLTLAANFKPSTTLESSVDALLKSAKLREEDIQQTEENMLKMNKLSVEEVEQRRGELRKMRELMFRAEIKARRINKIKSKTYRKIKRKQREKLGEAGEDSEGEEEDRLKKEVERAKERATLRHKHTGKWAQKMKTREGEEGRKEIEEMLARGEKLRRKIRGVESDEESGSEDEDDEGLRDAGDVERIKRGAFEELQTLDKEDDGLQEESGKKKSKSIFEMKFMKDAMARQQQVTDKMADDFVKEMGGDAGLGDNSDVEDAPEVDPSSGVVSQRVGGRMTFHPGATTTQRSAMRNNRAIGSLASDTSSVTLKSTDLLSPPQSPLELQRRNVPLPSSNSNPWLDHESEMTAIKAPKKNNEVVVGKDTVPREDGDEDDDAHSEVDAQEHALELKAKGKAKLPHAFEQRDLVALAFAGDNVVHEFEEAKKREIAADAPQEVDTTIPGWGSWGGTGMRKAPPKPERIKKIAGIDPTTRADFGKAHVIISEKRDKKAAKYLVKDLPYPYTSRAQFEKAMERPLGTEWNTRVAFQKGTMPRVVKKPGIIINPIEKMPS